MNHLSKVEQYWNKLAEMTNDPRSWHDLLPEYQHMIIQSLNLTVMVLNTRGQQ